MFKYFLLFLSVASLGFAQETVKESQEQEISLEELFSEEDLAALKDEEEELLFDNQIAPDSEVEEIFQ